METAIDAMDKFEALALHELHEAKHRLTAVWKRNATSMTSNCGRQDPLPIQVSIE